MARNGVGWTRTQLKRDNPLEHSLRSIQPLSAQLLLDTLRSLTRAINSQGDDLESRNNLRHSRVSNSSSLEDTWYDVSREDNSDLLKEFHGAFIEFTTDTFTHMHILLSSAMSRDLLSQHAAVASISAWTQTLRRDGKLIERTVNTFSSAAAAFRVRRKACNRRWREEKFHSLTMSILL